MGDNKIRSWRQRLHELIYESTTPAGKAFDIILIVLIHLSIGVVMLDSVAAYHKRFGDEFYLAEWIFTGLFTIEYFLRIICIRRPLKFIMSPVGLIDLLAILPSYLAIFIGGTHPLLILRALRLMRIFRIFKLTHFMTEMVFLRIAIQASIRKIAIFMLVVFTLIIILGSVMYLIEGPENGFTSIPESIYWAVVTVTTVGYGDISPVTPLGKVVASVMMLIGYGIIAVPTGILTTEIAAKSREKVEGAESCPACGREGHDVNARFCKWCGHSL